MMREQLEYLLTYHGEGCKISPCPDCQRLVRIAAILKEFTVTIWGKPA